MDPFEAAARMAGIRFSGSETGSGKPTPAVGQVQRVSGIATSDSTNGMVFVNLGGSSVTQDGTQGIEVPCECAVRAGQEVSVEIVGGRPRVTGVVGWGDELASDVADAAALAGAAVQSVDVEYAQSASQTVPPEGGWSTNAPAWQEGMHIWTRTKTVAASGASYSDPACISGRDGQDGATGPQGPQGPKGDDGTGVSAIEEQYYLSTSHTAQAGGSWSAAQPAWQEGRWIWTRSKVTWSDSTVTYTAPVLAQAMNGANEAASAAQADALESRTWYAECATPAATAAKAATIAPATEDFTLATGRRVLVRFAATNAAAVAGLTLDVNGTGAKPIRHIVNGGVANLYSVSNIRAGATYPCTYDGEVWIAQINVNTNNYDRIQHDSPIKAAEAIPSGRIIGGAASGYRVLAAGRSIDMAYPLLAAVSSIASGGTGKNNYEAYPSINAPLTGAVEAGAAGRMLYLKGTVSGSAFTVAQAPYLTTVVPAAADGYCYIPLGIMSSTSNLYFKPSQGLWGYLDGEFQRLDRAALGIATATSQHFWHADDGAHVTRATQAEWEATHSGPNSLWTSIGMLFRDGLTNLLGILSGATAAERGIAVYDGGGNAEANIVAKFTGDGVQVGRDGTANIRIFDDGIDLTGDSGALAGRIGSGGTGEVMASVVRTGGIYYGQSATFHFAPLPTGSSPTVYITLESSLDASILPHYGVVVKNHFLPIPGTWHLPQIWTISSAASGDGFDITLACLDDYDPALGYAYRLTVSWRYQGAAPYTYFGTAGEMGAYTFSAGTDNIVTGQGSSAVGCGLIASGTDQVVLGKFNVGSASSRVIIGNGTSGDSRSNVFDIDAEGKTHLKLHGDSMIAGAFASRVSSATTDVGQSTNWAYLDGSAGSANFCRWRFKCGIVFVQAYYESTAGIPAYSARTIGTIPAGYRPNHEVDAGGYPGSQAGAANSVIWVTAAGAVAINCTNGQSCSQFYGSISYPIG